MKRILSLSLLLLILIILNLYLITSKDTNIEVTQQPEAIAEEKSDTVPVPASEERNIVLLFTGDIMLGRTVMTKSIEFQDYLYPFRKVQAEMEAADIVFINLENPIIESCPIHTSGFTFCSPPESIQGLVYAGVDVANLENNHTLNWGVEGKDNTVQYLQLNGIDAVGHGLRSIKEVSGVKIGFVGFDFVTNGYGLDSEDSRLLAEMDEASDVLVIGVHWGNEYQDSANIHQRNMASELVKLGADIIIGHHPHWVQDADCFPRPDSDFLPIKNIKVELLRNGVGCPEDHIPVYYSLGNFVFDQMWSEETKKGLAVKVTLKGTKIVRQAFLPIYMSNWAQPEWINISEQH